MGKGSRMRKARASMPVRETPEVTADFPTTIDAAVRLMDIQPGQQHLSARDLTKQFNEAWGGKNGMSFVSVPEIQEWLDDQVELGTWSIVRPADRYRKNHGWVDIPALYSPRGIATITKTP